MNNPGTKRSQSINDVTNGHDNLLIAFKNNPHDPEALTKLVKSLNRSGKYRRSIKILNRVITAPDFNNLPDTFQSTTIKCARKSYRQLASKEIDDKNIPQALTVCEEMANRSRLFKTQDRDQEIETGSNQNQNNIIIKKRAFNNLLSLLVEKKFFKQAVELMANENCIVDYSLAVEIMKNFSASEQSKKLSNLNQHIDQVRKLVKSLGKEDDMDNILNNSMYSNTLYPLSPWREKSLSYSTLAEMKQWIDITGMEHIQNIQSQGKGIILVSSHMSTGRSFNLLLARMGNKVNALEVRDRMGGFGVDTTSNMNVFELGEEVDFPLRELYIIQKLLKKGEIVNMSGDGFKGKTGVATRFLGRTRNFKTSFAELALKTGAVAIPVFGCAHETGKIEILIHSPLNKPDKNLSHDEKVKSLILQYSSLLENIWQRYPGSIAWEQLYYYFSLPHAEGSPS